nr:hypothetical protein [Tanacetum cinerariifolium]
GNPQHDLKDKGVIDSGCSRHMTGNMSYLTDLEEINGRYVTFGGNPKGGKITCKAAKDETASVLKTFIVGLENLLSLKVKIIRCDNGTEFKNADLNQFCRLKGIKREFSVPRTPQQNGIAERKNRTLIEASRTLLEDSLLPIPFWAEAVNTACKFQGKVDKGFLIGYSVRSKAFRVFHSRTRIVQETLHVNFMENKPNVAGSGPAWLFDIDSLSQTMNYHPVLAENQSNPTAAKEQGDKAVNKDKGKSPVVTITGFRDLNEEFTECINNSSNGVSAADPLGKFNRKADEGFYVGYFISRSGPTWLFDIDTLTKFMNYQPVIVGNQPNPNAGIQEHFDADKAWEGNVQQYVIFLLWSFISKDLQNTDDDITFEVKEPEFEVKKPESEVHVSLSSSAKTKKHDDKTKRKAKGKIPAVGQISTNSTNTFSAAGPSNTAPDDPNMPALEDITYYDDEEDVGTEADFSNLETSIPVSPIPTIIVHKDHHVTQIIRDLSSAPQTRSMTRMVNEQGGLTQSIMMTFTLACLPVFFLKKNPKGYTKLLKIPVRLKLYRRSFFNSRCKSALLYGTIKEEVYVCQPLGYEDPDYTDKVYKVVKALYGLHQAPRVWYETLANYLLENGFQRGKIDQTLFIKKQKGNILLVQFYVDDIIFGSTNKDLCKAFERKFGLTDRKSASTPIDTEKPLLKDPDGKDVDVHTYRSMIGSLMYLTSSRPDICLLFVHVLVSKTPKASHLHAVKRIFKYLKGKTHLGLWYLKDSPFNLVAYSDSDYAGASLDRKFTTGGYQFLSCRLISCAMDSKSVAGLWVTQSSMKLLERTLHVTNVSSAGYITTPQMVLNSPCLTHIKN